MQIIGKDMDLPQLECWAPAAGVFGGTAGVVLHWIPLLFTVVVDISMAARFEPQGTLQ